MAGRRLDRHRTSIASRQGIQTLTSVKKSTAKRTQSGSTCPISLTKRPIVFQLKIGLALSPLGVRELVYRLVILDENVQRISLHDRPYDYGLVAWVGGWGASSL